MKAIWNVFQFEFSNYVKNKSFTITTIVIALVVAFALFIPAFFPGLIPGTGKQETASKEPDVEMSASEDEKGDETGNGTESGEGNTDQKKSQSYAVLDKTGQMDITVFESYVPWVEWLPASSEEEVKEMVQSESVSAGFVLLSQEEYLYYVKNTSFYDNKQSLFENAMKEIAMDNYIGQNGLDRNEFYEASNFSMRAEVVAIEKDGAGNYFYVYILLFILYFLILLYGNMIATNVTTEKSTRTIEVLVTSTDTNSLLFGKVLAGTTASVLQSGIIIGSAVISYMVNRSAWNGMLDIALNIPGEVLAAFAVFGILGYVFYMFIFGVLGALVSKTEDISKSTGIIQFIYIIVFLVCIYSLSVSDSIWMKVMSYLPFSSCNAMVARIALGSVGVAEIIISLFILIASIIITGFIGSKIYRMATLMYGNPIKLKDIFKLLGRD